MFPNEEASSVNYRQQDGQYELFMQTERTVRQALQTFVLNTNRQSDNLTAEPLLAGALAMALCYIHR